VRISHQLRSILVCNFQAAIRFRRPSLPITNLNLYESRSGQYQNRTTMCHRRHNPFAMFPQVTYRSNQTLLISLISTGTVLLLMRYMRFCLEQISSARVESPCDKLHHHQSAINIGILLNTESRPLYFSANCKLRRLSAASRVVFIKTS
jgi:hypothetical protein